MLIVYDEIYRCLESGLTGCLDVLTGWAPYLVNVLYTAILLGLALYALHALVLIVLYLWHRKAPSRTAPAIPEDALPWVTVQVPLRNEQHVVQQVLQAVAGLSWPRDRLELQILDDSDDVTTAPAAEQVALLRAQGLAVDLLHRDRPEG